ncbi:hypothetical protein Tco_0024693 [Tanacetum coccineum]
MFSNEATSDQMTEALLSESNRHDMARVVDSSQDTIVMWIVQVLLYMKVGWCVVSSRTGWEQDNQDKYVDGILKKFGFSTVKTASTPMETSKPLLKDAEAEDVDVQFQVTPKVSHLHAVKRIFRYLKGQPKLGLWYPKDSLFDLEAYTDSDYAGASLDMKSTTGGYQFLRSRLISWQCKKQTIVANSTTEAEYVAAGSCFKNPVFHSKIKHIEIRHHFIRDSIKKKLIQMIKIYTNQNVVDLLTKAFDVSRLQYLIETEYVQMMLETADDDAIQVSTVGLTYYYALTENPTIYVSLIQQFWNTATARTLDNGEMERTTTIDGKVKIVSEASIRMHLKLEYSDGISTLPTTEIFEQLALMGYGPVFQGEGSTVPVESHHTPTSAPSTSQPPSSSPSRRTTRQESIVPQPISPTQTNVANEAASTGVDIRHGGAATTVTSLDAGQGSGTLDKTPSMPHDSPLPRVHTHLSQEFTYLETKKVYGTAFTKLIKKVKKLEKTVKTRQARRKARVVVFDDEEDLEDPSKQGRKIAKIDQDPNISLVQHDAEVQGRHEHDMESDFEFTAAEEVYTAEKGVSTARPVSTAGANSAKDKGKAIMEEAETIQTKTKLQLEQERLGYEEALRKEEQAPHTNSTEDLHVSVYQEMGSHTLKQLKSYSFDEIKNLFETTMRRVHTIVPIESESERLIPELAAGSSKRDAEEELVQESSNRQKTGESSEPVEEPKDKKEEELS